MSPAGMRAVLALGLAALVTAGAAPALGASRTVTLEGWSPRVLAFSADRLIWAEAATVRVDPARIGGAPAGAQRFDYYRAEAFRVRLNGASTRFSGEVETSVSVRTSIGAMQPGALAPTGDGGFVLVPGSRRFAPPVVWCCSPDGVETVLESDGRADAPVASAAAWAPGAARYVTISGGLWSLKVSDPSGRRAPSPALGSGASAPGLVAASAAGVGWVDPAAPTVFLWRPDGAAEVPLPLPGAAIRVWGAPGLFLVAVRVGSGIDLLRIDEGPAPRPVRVWRGPVTPRVAVGGGAVAAAQGRRVWASRAGVLRPVVRVRRQIDAVGVDGRRLAWIERGSRRGTRVGVVRLGRVP